jgi:hypothetical protein
MRRAVIEEEDQERHYQTKKTISKDGNRKQRCAEREE